METNETTPELLEQQFIGTDAANGLLMDALLLVIAQQIPKLLPPMEQHFREMAARDHAGLSQQALSAMQKRVDAIQTKLQLLHRVPTTIQSAGAAASIPPPKKRK